MNKRGLILWMAFFLAVAGIAHAQEMKGPMMGQQMKGSMMGEEGMMGKGGMMGMMGKGGMMKKCPMMGGMMMKSMMGTSLVATSDGGVVVLKGHKLTKYDKNLNIVKEVGVKMDMEGMQKMMSEMMKKCPMFEKMMSADELEQVGADDVEESQDDDHESHH